jgi:mRNA deadenylase 3'-5' endonuclease subunit Ccr4
MDINDTIILKHHYEDNNYTTYNYEDKYKYIDYIFSNKKGESLTNYITNNTNNTNDTNTKQYTPGIITSTSPSDHIPVTIKFTITNDNIHKKKYLKYKQKYLKQKFLYL